MSVRKTKLIQERNILLERKYILEQTTPPSPQVGGVPSPAPQPSVQPTTTNNTISFEDVKKVYDEKKFCSKVTTKLDVNNIKEIEKGGKKLFYYPTTDTKGVLCVDDERTKI